MPYTVRVDAIAGGRSVRLSVRSHEGVVDALAAALRRVPADAVVTRALVEKYDPNQPRDDHGRWSDSGGGGGSGESGGDGGGGGGDGGGSDAPANSPARNEEIIQRPTSHYKPANENGSDTQARHTREDGTLTAPRKELHQAIQDQHFEGVKPADGRPTFTMLGGGPAAGKSTLPIDVPDGTVKIDVDHVRTKLPEYRDGIAARDPKAAAFTHEESSAIARGISRRAADGKYNAMLDGTGNNSLDSLRSKAEVFRAAGHEVVAHYVTIDTDVAVERAAKRAARTGRHVPETFIRETHAGVSRVFPEAVKQGVFDRATLWDNSGSAPVKIMSSVGKTITVHDQAAWDRFIAKGRKP